MANRETLSKCDAVRAISPTSVSDNTAQNGQPVDMKGADSCLFVVVTGTLADANATFAVKLQHRDGTSGDYADVPANMMHGDGSFRYDDDNDTRKLAYIGDKRYVRVVITPAANTGAAALCAVALKGHLNYAPPA